MQRFSGREPSTANGAEGIAREGRIRRLSRRVTSSVAVDVLAPRTGRGVVLNASEGGVRVAVDCALQRGERVDVRLTSPSGVSLVDTLRVIWSRRLPDGSVAGLARSAAEER